MQSKIPHAVAVVMLVTTLMSTASAQKRSTPRPPTPKVKAATEVKATTAVKAANADPLSSREREILDEINLARANPTGYIKFLEQFKQYYSGKEIHFPDGYVLLTNEGVSALDEAIAFVRNLKPLPPLEARSGMILGAKDHLGDMIRTGRTGHKGSDGSVPEDRLSCYGIWIESVGENIVYRSTSARYDVISLIIDDGVRSRGHRKNIFKPGFHVIGISLSQPLQSGTICVITFAGGFTDKAPNEPKTTAPTSTRF
jgi:uncharacterized protein YkwD